MAESDTEVLVRNLRTEASNVKHELQAINESIKALHLMLSRILIYGAIVAIGGPLAILVWNVGTDFFWGMVGGRP